LLYCFTDILSLVSHIVICGVNFASFVFQDFGRSDLHPYVLNFYSLFPGHHYLYTFKSLLIPKA